MTTAPLDRQEYVVKPSPCLSSLKVPLVKHYQAQPKFFNIMEEMTLQEKDFLGSLVEERQF